MIPVELVNYWFTPFPRRFESDDTVYKIKHNTLCDAFMAASNGMIGGTVHDLEQKVFWTLSRHDYERNKNYEDFVRHHELRRQEKQKLFEGYMRNW